MIIIFSILLILLSLFGIFQLEITSDPINLWVEPSSPLNKIRKRKIEVFNEDFRIESIFLKPRDETHIEQDDFDIINKEHLKQVYYLELLLKKGTTSESGKNIFEQLCWTAFSKGDCVTQSPMNYW